MPAPLASSGRRRNATFPGSPCRICGFHSLRYRTSGSAQSLGATPPPPPPPARVKVLTVDRSIGMATYFDGNVRRATDNSRTAARRSALARQCPQCGRKSALVRFSDETAYGRACRWCSFCHRTIR